MQPELILPITKILASTHAKSKITNHTKSGLTTPVIYKDRAGGLCLCSRDFSRLA